MPEWVGVSLPRTPPQGIYLAFDFGLKRIGYATGNTTTFTTSAGGLLHSKDGVPDWTAITALIDQWAPVALVVGLPFRLNSEAQLTTQQARKFGQRLSGRTGKPVYFVPEQLSSKMAESHLQRTGKKTPVDAVTAQVILDHFFQQLVNSA